MQHAVAVAEHLDAVVAVEAAAFGISNAFVRRQRSLLGARRQLDAALGVQLGRVEQIEIRRLERQQIFLRRAGAGIFRGVARDVQRRLYGAGDGVRTEIGGRGAAFALAVIHGDAQRAIAVELDVFHLAEAGADADAGRFGDRDFRRVGTGAGQLQRLRNGLFQRLALFCNLSDYFHQSAIINQKIVEKSAGAA